MCDVTRLFATVNVFRSRQKAEQHYNVSMWEFRANVEQESRQAMVATQSSLREAYEDTKDQQKERFVEMLDVQRGEHREEMMAMHAR